MENLSQGGDRGIDRQRGTLIRARSPGMIARERNNQRLADQNCMLETEIANRWPYEGYVELASAQGNELRRYGHCLDLSLDLLSLRDELTDR
jgi:hypothetical protein